MDGESGAEIYSAATSRDQARIIFETARQMVKRSPALQQYVNVLTNNISVPSTAGKFEPVSSEAGNIEGKDVYVGLIDELHLHKTREVYDLLKGGTAARSQPLIWVVTTAGFLTEGICKERYDYAVKVLEGVVDDDELFAYIAQPDKEDDILSPEVWIKANPNLGVSVKIDDLKNKARTAREIPSAYNTFACRPAELWQFFRYGAGVSVFPSRAKGWDAGDTVQAGVCGIGMRHMRAPWNPVQKGDPDLDPHKGQERDSAVRHCR